MQLHSSKLWLLQLLKGQLPRTTIGHYAAIVKDTSVTRLRLKRNFEKNYLDLILGNKDVHMKRTLWRAPVAGLQ